MDLNGRYSGLMKRVFALLDLSIVIGTVFFVQIKRGNIYLFVSYLSVLWVTISFKNYFYEVQRHTRIVQVITLLFTQIFFFAVVLYTHIGVFKQPNISRLALAEYLGTVFVLVSFVKIITFILLKKYRSALRGNIRNVIVIGENEKTPQLI